MNGAASLADVLKKIHPYSKKCKEALDQSVSTVFHPRGYFLAHSDSVPDYVYFLEKGFAVSYRYHKDVKVVTAFWKPGEIILSPKSFFSRTKSEELIQLAMDSQLKSLSWDATRNFCNNFKEANIYARTLAIIYNSRSEQLITDLHLLTAEEHYLKLIRTYPRIEGIVSQELISSYLNITPQSLSRIKKNLS